ncbi:oxalurate catabolism protein HpxZ [Xanthomonas sp. CFBP 8703]|jgi:ketosteroid isomerase-like protein|uniref:Oxalurate catabolism protein HpxZ n=1 Tax=Xanthomonas bonasiae TaxID=2810351 RepID=A0ABS3B0S7_9XANT|nr:MULTISPECIES: oxalurate catabolism protein HpxZ [Xanthomonas]MBD7921086.1 oxalurate catabolism protein HpxZ [Xanthomonas surreyensis]MBN6102192.1 oxalurate catabolism protein HpxZ [Xanthomonas bonasiae]MBN6110350.1 oxalurate catabolism protein HpxZ [Xanthomonas bonasiae]NYF20533.1 ketosteroid isomerase-like protein [Xanthomonas sp. JAI131]
MIVDAPEVLAEVQAAFADYERALMADDVAALDRLFHDAPTTVRYGVGEALYGAEAIRAFRRGRGGSPQRRLLRVQIVAYGRDFATADAEFLREGATRPGRQSQSWVRFADGWKVVSAHVSLQGDHA